MRKVLLLLPLLALWGFHSVVSEANYSGDKVHSSISFGVGYAGGLTTVKGMFTDFTVKMYYDDADITKSTVTAEIQVKSVNSGNAGRDKHLQGEDFFETDKFPTITFVSKKVEKKGEAYVLTGDFTMHGVTKEISFPFTITGKGLDTRTRGTMVGFAAKPKIKRSEFGMSYGIAPTAMSDEVEVELHLLMKPDQAVGTFVAQ
ncbi:MAG: polyisoprenoid-binding protein [Fimbriimonadaceae bacterium]|nr:polyisoprenoid-binding protein [Fimbriimonadaceae bacterium]